MFKPNLSRQIICKRKYVFSQLKLHVYDEIRFIVGKAVHVATPFQGELGGCLGITMTVLSLT